MRYLFSIICLMAILNSLSAQENFNLSGYLRDGETGEELLFGSISVPSRGVGVTTNEYGYFSLSLPAGTHEVFYTFMGYDTRKDTIELLEHTQLNIELFPAADEIETVVVTDEISDGNVKSAEMSVLSLDMKEAKKIPVIFGEQDVVKTLQLMPGVSAAGEGSAGFFVRGGEADQNLVLLDEAPVYNASHLLGFFSVFNSDALKDVKLYKGGIPAQYGGRLSSVMDVRMKNGNSKYWMLSGGIGLISSRLTLEGPLVKDKGSIMISGRRTYADVVAKAVSDVIDGQTLYFYDFNAKANYKIGEKDRLYASGYFGRDVFKFEGNGLDWGNATATLRWNHIFGNQLFANSTFVYSDYNYGFGVQTDDASIELAAGIQNFNLQQDYSWYPNPKNSVKFGWRSLYHDFDAGNFTAVDNEGAEIASSELQEQYALENAIYLSNEQKMGAKFTLNYGLRLSSFSNIGAHTHRAYGAENEIISETEYGNGAFYNTYFGLEPRLNAVYLIDDKRSLKASYNRNYQYIHLLSNSTASNPTDIWIPSNLNVKAGYGDQVAVGYFQNFMEDQLEFSIEGYYKHLYNQVDYEDGADPLLNEDLEAELVFGQGRAFGGEFFLRKRKGKLTGWLSYTLSSSKRQFEDIMDGEWFSARQDRTHDIALVGVYELNRWCTISASWVYYTGDAVTFPTGKYEIDGEVINLYSGRNADRMPNYHRLDLGATFILKDSGRWYHDLNISIYNAYHRMNAYTIDFRESQTVPNTTEAARLALFGIVPSISWNFKFK
jgi:hypothetical protein